MGNLKRIPKSGWLLLAVWLVAVAALFVPHAWHVITIGARVLVLVGFLALLNMAGQRGRRG
jgi:hypothetical protein